MRVPSSKELRAWGGFGLALALWARWRLPSLDAPTALAAWSPFRCPVHALTGWACPSCGLTRSFLAALAGDYALAFELHHMGPFLLAGLLALCIAALWTPEPLRWHQS
ncbi:MAG: DUF2752 domain-containing protein [Myxococcota bacterium]